MRSAAAFQKRDADELGVFLRKYFNIPPAESTVVKDRSASVMT